MPPTAPVHPRLDTAVAARKPGGRRVSGGYLATTLAGLAVLFLSAGPIIDPDLFWHVRVGGVLLHHWSLPTPDPWAYTLPHAHWHSSAWLSEVGYYLLHRLGGYPAIVGLRFAVTVALLTALAVQLHRRARPAVAAGVFAIVCVPLLGFGDIQDRPQLFSLVLVVGLAGAAQRARATGTLPSLPLVAAMTWLWAMLHGLWVLVPALLCLVAALRALDRRAGSAAFARACAARVAVAVAVAALTPVGPALLLTPFRLIGATGSISEWQPTSVTDPNSWGLLALLAVLVWFATRSPVTLPRSELVYVAVVVGYGMWAVRNAGVATLLLAPVVADRVMAARLDRRAARPVVTTPRAFVAALAGLGVLAAVPIYLDHPVIRPSLPHHLTARLAAQPGTLRVLDDYDVSGYLIDRAAPHVRVAIDGRADRYGGAFISRYMDMLRMTGDWNGEVHALRPNVALLDTDTSALATGLVAVDGWRVAGREGHWVLLTAPGVTLR